MTSLKKLAMMLGLVGIVLVQSKLGVQASEATDLTGVVMETQDITEDYVPEEGVLAENDELFAEYVDRAFYASEEVEVTADYAGSRLTGVNKTIYDYLKSSVTDIANGVTSSTTIVIPMNAYSYREASLQSIMESLLADCPYELFWFDKTEGVSVRSSYTGDTTFYFYVAPAYAGSADFTVNSTAIASVQTSVNNAKAIVNTYAVRSDYNKLVSYMNEICSLTSYNDDAMDDSVPYGDPWQLVYVFDGDSSTNVVCEGYAKAFQYLCDMSTFKNDIKCYNAAGYMMDEYSYGPHMWNVVQMEDGLNYLVDITNCDEDTIGYPDELFLVGGTDMSEGGCSTYKFDTTYGSVYYAYDDVYEGLQSDGYLAIASSDYVPSGTDAAYVGNVNTEMQAFGFDNNTYYISGQIVVVEWIDLNNDGVLESTVPDYAPVMQFVATDGSEQIDVFVTPTGTNTYYFDRLLSGGLTPGKEYKFMVTSGNPNNQGAYKTVPVYTGTSVIGTSGTLGSINNQDIMFKTGSDGTMIIYSMDDSTPYEGNVNSLLLNVGYTNSSNGNFVSGEIVITEWIDGNSTVPRTTPKMSFESYDGTEISDVFITPTGTNTFYFDRNLSEDMDVTKEYIFRVTLTEPNNTSAYKSMVATTNEMETKEGVLWETATQIVKYKTVAADGDNQLRVYAVNK